MAVSTQSYDFLQPPTQSGDLGTLGHYRVIAELGRGGMGFVFRAEDVKLKRAVALKVMNQKIAATPHSRRRFIHEARAMAAVHHDNVATIFEVGESNGIPFMAMEMLKGSTLETFNKAKNQLDFEQIIDYARQIARGLAAAHANGIVHRDIKPANIWIEEGKDRIKILDFGLALASTPVDHLAGRGAVIGTPGYLSPEQARSEPLDDRSDLYSLGVVLYELCTGKLPIQAKSVSGQLISILAHRPIPINQINPEIPQPLCDLVHCMLRKEPRSRPSSAVALQEELDRVETECHAKSQVAQAINKLQMGLSEVVNKSADMALFDTVEEFQDTLPDPLAAIPSPVTMVPPARPVAAKKAAPPAAPAWQAYWPFAAIGAVVLIALPVLTFAFSGAGKDEAYVISGTAPESAPATAPQAQSNKPGPSSNNKQAQQNRQQNRNDSVSKPKAGGQRKAGQNRQGNRNQNRAGGGQNIQAKSTPPDENRGGNAGAGRGQAKPHGGNNSPAAGNLASVASRPVAATVPTVATPTLQPDPKPDPQPPAVEMKWTSISTAEGRGADVMVQKSGNQKFGTKPSIGIGTRGTVETHHSYLQFDLASVADVKKHVQSAELILTLLGGRERPKELEIRVYGIADLGAWQEELLEWKNSYSSKGIESFPMIADIKSSYERLESFKNKKIVRISTPELAQFVAAAGGDTVTLVITGSATGADVVRFISRNHTEETPPTLRLETPRNPPPQVNKNNRRR
jgi:serine/threonine protein kinase